MGDGDNSVIFLGDDGANLTSHYWYPVEVEPNYPSYYPYITTAEGASRIKISRIRVEGNTETASTNLHVGIAAESATDVVVEHVSVWKINYFPELAPARPSGQWRRGWNIAFLRCNRAELAHSVVQYGAYECVRVGPNSETVWVHDCLIEYGWRTGFQVIRGCNNIVLERCTINQDDFDAYDTNACVTLHSSDDEAISGVTIRGCRLTGKLFTGSASGAGIFTVYHTTYSLMVEDTTVHVTAEGLSAMNALGNAFVNNSQLVSANYCAVVVDGTGSIVAENSTIESAASDRACVIALGNVKFDGCNINSAFTGVQAIPSKGTDVHVAISNSKVNITNASANVFIVSKTAAQQNVVSFDIVGNELNSKIYLDSVDGVVTRKCTIADNTIAPATSNRGIHIPSTATTEYKLLTIRDNVVTQGTAGILINSAGVAVITGNDLSGCTTGITATNENNIIKDNILPAS